MKKQDKTAKPQEATPADRAVEAKSKRREVASSISSNLRLFPPPAVLMQCTLSRSCNWESYQELELVLVGNEVRVFVVDPFISAPMHYGKCKK